MASPSTTVPVWSTQIRSETRMCLKFIPNGLSQKRSRCSGSRTVMCPATPSSNPNLPNSRNDAASRCLRWRRSSSVESKVGKEAQIGKQRRHSQILGLVRAVGPGLRCRSSCAGGRPEPRIPERILACDGTSRRMRRRFPRSGLSAVRTAFFSGGNLMRTRRLLAGVALLSVALAACGNSKSQSEGPTTVPVGNTPVTTATRGGPDEERAAAGSQGRDGLRRSGSR